MDVDIIFDMYERGVRRIVIETFKDLFCYSLASRVFAVIMPLHLVFVVLVENVSVEDENRESNEVRLI